MRKNINRKYNTPTKSKIIYVLLFWNQEKVGYITFITLTAYAIMLSHYIKMNPTNDFTYQLFTPKILFSLSGMDSCFTKASTTMFSMGYESKTALTSSNCASKCLSSSDDCGAIYVTAGDSCSILRYDTDLSSSMSASHLVSTHYYPRRTL